MNFANCWLKLLIKAESKLTKQFFSVRIHCNPVPWGSSFVCSSSVSPKLSIRFEELRNVSLLKKRQCAWFRVFWCTTFSMDFCIFPYCAFRIFETSSQVTFCKTAFHKKFYLKYIASSPKFFSWILQFLSLVEVYFWKYFEYTSNSFAKFLKMSSLQKVFSSMLPAIEY